jgi:predicted glutamine amidotransferase
VCRLFGLSAAPDRVNATFWLVDAPDSLARQSRAEPDGVGLGTFAPDGAPFVYKRPIAAYEDAGFAREAKELSSATFIAHVRYATTGALTPPNTHPFEQDGRLLAHNGVVEGLDRLDEKIAAELASVPTAPLLAGDLVHGETDSERIFALVTAYARQGREVGDALVEAITWIGTHLPVFAINLILTTPTELWALRYPDTHDLYLLHRAAGGGHGDRHLDHASAAGTVRVRSADLARSPSVVVATERMDEDPAWQLLAPGELVHVAPGPVITSRIGILPPPAHPLTLADLHARARAAQAPGRPAPRPPAA